jgi:hypothetical protein
VKPEDFEGLDVLVSNLINEHNFFEVFFKNFENYATSIKQAIEANQDILKGKTAEKNIVGLHTHQDQISVRLSLLSLIAVCSQIMITKKQINDLWEALVIKSPIDSDEEALYQWLKISCDSSSKVINLSYH